ncbi:MAG: PLP-dependent aminotransferase family protein [Gammaproteobacteria bacterium]|nr:PLP-dependent aminotransferase family protein [Gammaproteobacteria bacterium]
MPRQSRGALLSTLQLDANSRAPLYRQLEDAIRRIVIDGELPTGARLPASRQLAEDLGVSRLTVKNAYEQLVTEQFLETRPGAGTFVGRISATELAPAVELSSVPARKSLSLSQRANRISQSRSVLRLGGTKPFRPGVPALDQFPSSIWASTHSKVLRHSGTDNLGYGPPGGLLELKQAIANHVQDHRGVRVDPLQIIITAGAQQAFVLIAFTLLNPGDRVWFEDPGHIAGRDAMHLFGADVKSVQIDNEGFDINQAVASYPDPQLIFLTPSHQHPLGITMSLERRMQIIDYAKSHNCWIVEDDYDSEFRYQGRALPAMQCMDNQGQILYVGSFSKTLFPGLRLGYLIAPPVMVEAFSVAQTLMSQNVSPVLQKTLARFIDDGAYNAHIRKMRSLYSHRLDIMHNSLSKHCNDLFHFTKTDAGMHLVAWLRDRKLSDQPVCESIWDAGIDCLPVSMYCDKASIDQGIMLGFSCAPEHEIENLIMRMDRVVRGLL